MPILLFLVAAALLTGSVVHAQGDRYRPVGIRSCPFADSLLGPTADDVRGAVRGFYDAERDTSYFVASVRRARPVGVSSATKFGGKGPARFLSVQIEVEMGGRDIETVTEVASRGPLRAAFVLNDSVTVYSAATSLSPVTGSGSMRRVFARAVIRGDDVLKVARARHILMKVGLMSYVLDDERPGLRALVRVAVCPP